MSRASAVCLPGADELTDLLGGHPFDETGVSAGGTGVHLCQRAGLYHADGALHNEPPPPAAAGLRRCGNPRYAGGFLCHQSEMAGASISLLRLDGELAGTSTVRAVPPHRR